MLLKSKWSACSSNLSSMVFPFSSFVLNKKLSVENIKEKLVNCTKKEIISFFIPTSVWHRKRNRLKIWNYESMSFFYHKIFTPFQNRGSHLNKYSHFTKDTSHFLTIFTWVGFFIRTVGGVVYTRTQSGEITFAPLKPLLFVSLLK